MSTVTVLSVKDIEAAFEAVVNGSEDYDYGSWAEYYEGSEPEDLPGIGSFTCVKEDSGGEGHAEDIEMVYKVTFADGSPDRYFSKSGYYASHDGSHWDGPFCEVKPVTRPVIFYDVVKDFPASSFVDDQC